MTTDSSQSSQFYPISVGDFFDQVSQAYDDSIRKAIPPYVEMFDALLGYCFFTTDAPLHILELGCGTGNLSVLLKERFPQAQLTLVDLSADMLKQASDKLGGEGTHIHLVQSGFMGLCLEPGQFDMVISSVALHHLNDQEKPVLYARMFEWLKPGGLFRCADETLNVPRAIQDENMARWEVWARQNGAQDQDITLWTEHAAQYDHYAPLSDHFKWLAKSGFINVDCYWRKLMWTVFGCAKPV